MKRSSAPITVRVGHREFVKINATRYDWRDIYHLILTLGWPQFAGLVLGIYILINLFFATLYLLGGRCIAELAPGSFSDAFFFSVETLATVGYGHAYPDTLYGHCVTTLEILVGLFGLAVMTGLIFVRFSRPTARIMFSKVVVVAPFNGFPTLTLRLANLRHHAMVEAEFRLLFMRSELTQEGEDVRRFYPLRLQFDHLISFPAALTLRHVIDETSPLFGLTQDELKLADSRMLVSVVCVDPVIQAPVQTQTEYLHDQIAWNRRFAEIYTEDSFGRYTLDLSKFDDTMPG
ncbi:MAG: ATP-sensitive inward rectifier potassium channel 10 [Verrucomicrobia bacterium]|nr:ATP-sensitive inward rectifier potassium channel 10 [Verrucomicrobiota bacterium]MBV8378373.1 ATP-sensitive inward rectifier potassium channel 10 [Verrucomicrobiota bacterium]